MTVAEIKAAIDRLSLSERAELEKMLHGWEDDEWDRQMMADAKSGKLDKLIAKVDADIDACNFARAAVIGKADPDFWQCYNRLPREVQATAREKYRL